MQDSTSLPGGFPWWFSLVALPGGSEDKASACNARDPGSIPGLGIQEVHSASEYVVQ